MSLIEFYLSHRVYTKLLQCRKFSTLDYFKAIWNIYDEFLMKCLLDLARLEKIFTHPCDVFEKACDLKTYIGYRLSKAILEYYPKNISDHSVDILFSEMENLPQGGK